MVVDKCVYYNKVGKHALALRIQFPFTDGKKHWLK